MTTQEIIDYCLTKNQSYVDYPFGEIPICIKVNKKIFAQVYPHQDDYKVTLKCDMMTGDFFRHQYPSVVVRGYHCPPVQQPYWNTVFLDRIPDEELLNMIDHAYTQVLKSFSKKVQGELFGRI